MKIPICCRICGCDKMLFNLCQDPLIKCTSTSSKFINHNDTVSIFVLLLRFSWRGRRLRSRFSQPFDNNLFIFSFLNNPIMTRHMKERAWLMNKKLGMFQAEQLLISNINFPKLTETLFLSKWTSCYRFSQAQNPFLKYI